MTQQTTKQVFHNSKLIIINGLVQPLILLLVFFGQNIDNALNLLAEIHTIDSGQLIYVFSTIGFMLLVMILSAIRSWFVWKNTFISLDKNEIYYQKRTILIKKSKQANLENITNVTLDSTLFNRLLGLKKVSIDINTTSTAEEDDFSIVLGKQEAINFQAMINSLRKQEHHELVRKTLSADDFNTVTTEPTPLIREPEEYLAKKQFSLKDATKHIFLDSLVSMMNFIIFAIIVLLVFIQYKGDSFEVKDLAVVIFPVLYIIYDILKVYNKAFNFTIRRSKKNIYLSYGLTHKTEYMIPVKNIVSLSVRQTILSACLGYQYLKVETIGITDNTSNISLFMKKDQIPAFAEGFIPEFPVYQSATRRPISVIKYFFMKILCFWLPIGLIVDYTVPMVNYATYIALALTVATTIVNYLAHGYQIVEEGVVIRSRLAANYELIPFKNIEQIKIKTNLYYQKVNAEEIKLLIRDSNGKRETDAIIYQKGAFDEVIDYVNNGLK
ncbi:PH domain-containing protein [Granulicatella balaenopterae]